MTTRWTLVGKAVSSGDTDSPNNALGDLFGIYWQPLYRFVRRTGKSAQDAEDLVQGFFERLMVGDGLRLADPERGCFRSFLLSAMKNHMANQWRRDHSQKRGGFTQHMSLDWEDAETGLKLNAKDTRSPDKWYDREWAVALLDKVLNDMEQEEEGFTKWKPFLSMNGGQTSYAELAREEGMGEGAVRVAVHRLRKRYRVRMRKEIAGTLEEDSMVDQEMQVLLSALSDDFS
jgi:RNA polymerase sigma-70 factor (ECF subfamily)